MATVDLTEATFEAALEENTIMLIDFWAVGADRARLSVRCTNASRRTIPT